MGEDQGGGGLTVEDLAGLSEPLSKIVEVIAAGCGRVYSDVFATWIMRSHVAARIIEARGAAEVLRIEAEGSADALAIKAMGEELAAIVRRETAEGQARPRGHAEISPFDERLFEGARRRLANVGSIAAGAIGRLPVKVSDEPVDPDWVSRFFADAENVSSQEMQALWAEVLARETARPGQFSLKTIDVMRNLTRRDAELLRKALAYRFANGILQGAIEAEKLTLVEYRHLCDMDLCSTQDVLHEYAFDAQWRALIEHDGTRIVLRPTHGVDGNEMHVRCYALTIAGRELRPLFGRVALADDYAAALNTGLIYAVVEEVSG